MESKIKVKPKKNHLGRNIARIRAFRGIKQATLAAELGWQQQQLSELEKQEDVPEEVLEQIADLLGVTVEIIKEFDERAVIYNINHYNDIHDNTYQAGSSTITYSEPNEKIVELYDRLLNFLEQEKARIK
ncbi:helix-turn-helix transcriptional regulator [Sphingobacterium sp. DR205]|uniref:helix-turn-helix domain-containing protein n=1 Tax=Sphingobacterium sp. DR205 TaxID=2713573 RepID=UPI0013E42014|nr:helix-turn-helix transcriptional regulator [Sphingobacterium sp. DR205]QIH35904.1 helix-turn-helix transcriptional regulator [Sphingobacterium sp. DR205]